MSQIHILQTAEQKEARVRLGDLARARESLSRRFEDKVRPAPSALWDNRVFIDRQRALYLLQVEHWRNFPVELAGLTLGDDLRAYFDCYVHIGAGEGKHPVTTRLTLEEIEDVSEYLRHSTHNPVTEWNLLQCNAALNFAALLPRPVRQGVPADLVESFERDDAATFATKLDSFVPGLR